MKLSELITLEGHKEFYEIVWDKPPETVMETTTMASVKKIDMSRCIESGILMEFWDVPTDEEDYAMSILMKIDHDCFRCKQNCAWYFCRPRFGFPHANPMGWEECPLPEGFVIRVWFRDCDSAEFNQYIKLCCWADITMFEVLRLADGYEH